MIDRVAFLAEAQKLVGRLEKDLRARCDDMPDVGRAVEAEYKRAKDAGRTGQTLEEWRADAITQQAVAWVLSCVFVRFLEDNWLIDPPKLAGPGERLNRARDEQEMFFRRRPRDTDREYLLSVFDELAKRPGTRDLFGDHNPIRGIPNWLSPDAAKDLILPFFQKVEGGSSGHLIHDFTDTSLDTRFLGDLYQELSEAARKKYALLQTPVFVEEFILDRTLTPAIETFGLEQVKLIDPACGSGHFLLGTFARLLNDYITKPVDFPVALARIESVLARKRKYRHMLTGLDTLGEHEEQGSDGMTTLHTGLPSRLAAHSQFHEFLAGADGVRIKIGPYEADGVVGRGAMGIVIKAYDPALCRYVALKVPAPELAKCPKARQRFAQEGRFAAALRHPNVVSVHGVSEMEGIPYLVMEYVSGRSLQQFLDLGRKFTASEIARIGRETALGLAAAHDLRLIHRDIKPANLLVENMTNSVRIADFGLARDLDHDPNISQKGMLLGTPLFMSPEQVDGKPLTPASDLFGLGSVLYTLCTNQPPFSAESLSQILRAIAVQTPTPIQVHTPEFPHKLACVIENLLSKDPLQRYTAGVLAEHLAQRE